MILNPAGELVKRAGVNGQGPGELNRPSQITWDRFKKCFVISDSGNARFSRWDEKGNFIDEIPFAQGASQMRFASSEVGIYGRHRSGNRGNVPKLMSYNLKSFESSELWRYEQKTDKITSGSSGEMRVSIVFSWNSELQFAVGSNFVAVTFADTNRIHLFDFKGKPAGADILPKLPAFEVSETQVKSALDRLDPQFVAMVKDSLPAPGDWPAIGAMHIDGQDRIWVFGNRGDYDSPFPLVVFDKKGKCLLETQVKKRPDFIAGNAFYFHDKSDEDAPFIQKKLIQLR